mmetsp:Transcript_267/g.800  ORF Transcript_267/g.800 Transcript_267/m.800 type:complete len:231 (+) Transcript_267:1356-2048(+)
MERPALPDDPRRQTTRRLDGLAARLHGLAGRVPERHQFRVGLVLGDQQGRVRTDRAAVPGGREESHLHTPDRQLCWRCRGVDHRAAAPERSHNGDASDARRENGVRRSRGRGFPQSRRRDRPDALGRRRNYLQEKRRRRHRLEGHLPRGCAAKKKKAPALPRGRRRRPRPLGTRRVRLPHHQAQARRGRRPPDRPHAGLQGRHPGLRRPRPQKPHVRRRRPARAPRLLHL